MTLFLDSEDISALASHDLVLDAARRAIAAEQEGSAVLPPRMDVPLGAGFLRVMPAALGAVSGLKVMTLTNGKGTRYLLLMYRRDSGELVAILDAEEVTRLRTAATTAVAGEMLRPGGTSVLGLVGTGFEATGHLITLARCWPLERVIVYSPSDVRRQAFAERMSARLRIEVEPVANAAEVCGGADTVLLATKATEPVVDGKAFQPSAVVLSIGSTRPDLRELDRDSLARTATLMVDDPRQVLRESGDIIDAVDSGVLGTERIVSMGSTEAFLDHRARPAADGTSGRDLLVFKSVGTALQDLALASALVEVAMADGRGRELGELTRLKPFAATAQSPIPQGGAPR